MECKPQKEEREETREKIDRRGGGKFNESKTGEGRFKEQNGLVEMCG